MKCWKYYSGQKDKFFFLKMEELGSKVTGNCLTFPADGAEVYLL